MFAGGTGHRRSRVDRVHCMRQGAGQCERARGLRETKNPQGVGTKMASEETNAKVQ